MTKHEIDAVLSSIAELLRHGGLKPAGGTYRTLSRARDCIEHLRSQVTA